MRPRCAGPDWAAISKENVTGNMVHSGPQEAGIGKTGALMLLRLGIGQIRVEVSPVSLFHSGMKAARTEILGPGGVG